MKKVMIICAKRYNKKSNDNICKNKLGNQNKVSLQKIFLVLRKYDY